MQRHLTNCHTAGQAVVATPHSRSGQASGGYTTQQVRSGQWWLHHTAGQVRPVVATPHSRSGHASGGYTTQQAMPVVATPHSRSGQWWLHHTAGHASGGYTTQQVRPGQWWLHHTAGHASGGYTTQQVRWSWCSHRGRRRLLQHTGSGSQPLSSPRKREEQER